MHDQTGRARPEPVQVRLIGTSAAVTAAAAAITAALPTGPVSVRPSRYGADQVRAYLDVVIEPDQPSRPTG